MRLRLRRSAHHRRQRQDHARRRGLPPGGAVVSRPGGSPAASRPHRRPQCPAGRSSRPGRRPPPPLAVAAHLRSVAQQHRRPARGRRPGRPARRHHRHHRLARSRSRRHGPARGWRIDLLPGRGGNSADLVVFWGSDPVESHPRHLERYSLDAPGLFCPRGRADRFLVVADIKPTATSALADLFLPIEPGRDFESLWVLRALVRGVEPDEGGTLGAPLDRLRALAERMKTCRVGVVFFGLGLSHNGRRAVEALLSLVTELNAYARFYVRRMRVSGDVAGADSVLAWQTGYPFMVNFARGYPRYNPGEFSGQEMLAASECRRLSARGQPRPAAIQSGGGRHPAGDPNHRPGWTGRGALARTNRPRHHCRSGRPPWRDGLSYGRSAHSAPASAPHYLSQRRQRPPRSARTIGRRIGGEVYSTRRGMVHSCLAATRSLRSGARGLTLRSEDSASRLNEVSLCHSSPHRV